MMKVHRTRCIGARAAHPELIAVVLALASCLTLVPTAQADWRAETGVFRIGIVDTGSAIDQATRYEPFRLAVSEAVGLPAEVLTMRNGAALIDAHTSGRIDYAVLSSLGYAAAQTLCECLVPLAAPRSATGATGVRSVLIADGGRVDGMGDLQRTGVTWGPDGSLTGDLIPATTFTLDGTPLGEADIERRRAVSFDAAAEAFATGTIAAMFAWDYGTANGDDRPDGGLATRLDAALGGETIVLWRSDHVPFGPHVAHQDVPLDVRAALTAMLVAMNTDRPDAYDAVAPALSGGFGAVSEDDYAFAKEIVGKLAADE